MTRKTAIIILISLVAISSIYIAFVVITSGNTKDTSGITPGQDYEFSFPTSGPSADNPNDQNTNDSDLQITTEIKKLRQITPTPVSGFTTFERKIVPDENSSTLPEIKRDETETIYRYIDRATGNVFETTENKVSISRITNTTIPKIYEATFFDAGNGVVLRYLDERNEVETFVGKIATAVNEETGEQDAYSSITGIFLPKNVDSISKSQNNDVFFYTKDGRGYTFEGNAPANQKIIFESPLTEWLSEWAGSRIILTTKPSYLSEGFAFTVNPANGLKNKIIDGYRGLLVKQNSNLSKTLYSAYSSDSVFTQILDTTNQETRSVNVKTLADKCVWSIKNINIAFCAVPRNIPKNKYPDAWYLGEVSFVDDIYRIDFELNTLTKFQGLESSAFDIKDIQLSEQEEYLIFQNKKDSSLWSLDITE